MSEILNYLLIKAYYQWKNKSSPPVPLRTIKEYLELEDINLDDDNE